MINVSNEYKQYINNHVLPRDFTAKATITLLDSTVLNITEKDIVRNGLKIQDATSQSNSFQIGSAIINQCTLMLNNVEGKFDDYDFTDAIIRPFVGLRLSETTEWLAKGVFTVDEPTVASSIISLITLDNMDKFDTPFSDVTTVFPCTAMQLLQAVCTHCGVFLASSTFINDTFSIARRPNDEATTCREIVAWIAQLSGNFARINVNGALELKWYDISAFEQIADLDGGVFDSDTPYSSGDDADGGDFTFSEQTNIDGGTFLQAERYHHIYALNQATIGTDDVVITGIQVKAQGIESDYGETVLFGTTGYVIEMNNPLITENTASIIANSVGAKIVGMRFRPLNISVLSDPSIEAGDVAYVTNRKSNTYQILITNSSYTIGNVQNISCDAETPSKKQSVRFDALTKTIVEARNAVKQELTAYDIAVQQFNNLISHSFGVYKTEETLEDGSTIYYMHDKPTLEESQNIWKQTANTFSVSNDGGDTYVAGFDASGNAVFNILNTIGINADWINAGTINGININGSTFNGGSILLQGSSESPPFKIENKTTGASISSTAKWFRLVDGDGNYLVSITSVFGSGDIRLTDPLDSTKDITLSPSLDGHIQCKNVLALNNVSALTFTDRTPSYEGDALAEITKISNDSKGGIDHSTLPPFARKKIRTLKANKKGKTVVEEEGRDLGAMISILTVAVQQLTERVEKLEKGGK